MSYTVINWCREKEAVTGLEIPSKCDPCACLWQEEGGLWYDPQGPCATSPWGMACAAPGSNAKPGSVITGKFSMPLQGYAYYGSSSYTDPGPPPGLSGPPFYPPALQIMMSYQIPGSAPTTPVPVLTFDPAAGSVENFTAPWGYSGYCTRNPSPMAASGWPAFYRFWKCNVTIEMSGLQLATPDNPYPYYDPYFGSVYDQFVHADPDIYRCVVPYTGPLPPEAATIFLSLNQPTIPWTATQDSGIPIYLCSDNHPITDFNPTAYPNFLNTSTCGGIGTYTFTTTQKFQWLP